MSGPRLARGDRVAVVGAGVAGLACAEGLAAAGLRVSVLEKSRGAGGRCTTRRVGSLAFDHGAQYFTARDPDFAGRLERWHTEGAVAPWEGPFTDETGRHEGPPSETRWVGTPGMSAVGRALAGGRAIRFGTRVAALRGGPPWRLLGAKGEDLGAYEAVVVAVPAPQAVPLLEAAPASARAAAEARLSPCWAALVAFDAPVPAPFAAARLDDPCLAWAACNGTRPGRTGPATWTLHARPGWSQDHLEEPAKPVARALCEAFGRHLGTRLPPTIHLDAHRWRHALVTRPLGRPFLWDAERRLGACGDWCLAPRVEAAWQSGRALAGALAA